MLLAGFAGLGFAGWRRGRAANKRPERTTLAEVIKKGRLAGPFSLADDRPMAGGETCV